MLKPTYRITIERIAGPDYRYENDHGELIGIRAHDTGRTIGPMRMSSNVGQRLSMDFTTSMLSLWIAHDGALFVDGPWYPRPREAVPADIGWFTTA